MRLTFKRCTAVVLVIAMSWVNATRAFAMLAPAVSSQNSLQRAEDIKTIQTFLEQKEVSQKLSGFGLSEQEVKNRLTKLSDQQLHQVAMKIEKEHPAGDGAGIVVTVLVIGILVLLFVYLLRRV